jgi:hypothetical protein
MIRRNYYIYAVKNHGTNGEYSWWSSCFTVASWFANSALVYMDARGKAELELADKPGKVVEVICFSKL